MSLTSDNWLAVVEPRLTRPLFDPETEGRLHRLARLLPGECQGILEARLAPGTAPVDLSLRLRAPAQASTMISRLPPSVLRDFLSCWSKPESPLAPVRSVWLELDLDREPAGDTIPAPVVCAKLPREVDPGWVIGTLLPALNGQPPSTKQSHLILSCLEALPDSASVLYVFNLRARGSDAVRLEIFGMEPSQIPGYLQNVGLESVSEVANIVSIFEGVERLHLSFDVETEISPRIGIEGSYPRQPPREPRWEDLFARLVERGLCSPGKRDAALAWPGYDTFWTVPERWPLAEAGIRSYCVRTLSHLKAVCFPDREPEAKVYLTFGPLDRSDGTANSKARESVFST